MPKKQNAETLKLQTRAEAEAAVSEMSRLTALLGAAVATRDKATVKVADKYAPLIETFSAQISKHSQEVEAWCRENRAVEFGEKQSVEFPAGVPAFHKNPPSLEIIETKQAKTWSDVRALMKGLWKKYLAKPKPAEIDKRKVLKAAIGDRPKLTADKLATIGLKVAQEEAFSIELRACPNTLGQ